MWDFIQRFWFLPPVIVTLAAFGAGFVVEHASSVTGVGHLAGMATFLLGACAMGTMYQLMPYTE